jgi:hypothetical protein
MSHLSDLKVSKDPADANAPEVEQIREYTVSVDPPAQAGAGFFGFTVAVPGLLVARDAVIGYRVPGDLEANLKAVGVCVESDGNIRVTMQALAAIDGAAKNWTILVARKK